MEDEDSARIRKRRALRSSVYYLATLFARGQQHSVKLRDVSGLGALIEGELALSVDEQVVISREALNIASRVAWVLGRRAGLEFIDPPAADTVMRNFGRQSAR